jgi:hypothetical protein
MMKISEIVSQRGCDGGNERRRRKTSISMTVRNVASLRLLGVGRNVASYVSTVRAVVDAFVRRSSKVLREDLRDSTLPALAGFLSSARRVA